MTMLLTGPAKTLRRIEANAGMWDLDIGPISLFACREPVRINDRVEWTGTDDVHYAGTVIDRRGDLAYIAVLGLPWMFVAGLCTTGPQPEEGRDGD